MLDVTNDSVKASTIPDHPVLALLHSQISELFEKAKSNQLRAKKDIEHATDADTRNSTEMLSMPVAKAAELLSDSYYQMKIYENFLTELELATKLVFGESLSDAQCSALMRMLASPLYRQIAELLALPLANPFSCRNDPVTQAKAQALGGILKMVLSANILQN